MSGERRNVNLDALRAAAILAVLAYHIPQIYPDGAGALLSFTWYGQYGVDLFFVLSGWLIGGLYWREFLARGSVQLRRFWARRWLRTVPPYAVALALSWVAVASERGQPFDPLFLVFLQNYEAAIPFFLVSWSLCVEEHFYLLAPVLLLLLRALPLRGVGVAASIAAIALPSLLRFVEWQPDLSGFGYFHTATHLRADGLAIGFVLATVAHRRPGWLPVIDRTAAPGAVIALVAVVALEAAGGRTDYALGGLAYAVLLGALLVVALRARAIPGLFARATTPVAAAAYSIYLTHPLMLHVAARAYERLGLQGWIAWLAVVSALVVPAAALFYWLVERNSVLLRDRYWPRRSEAAAAPA